MAISGAQSASAVSMTGGFSDPVFQSQAVFRAVMDAMARPGTVAAIDDSCTPPAPLLATTGAIFLTLADADTVVWLDKPLKPDAQVGLWLTFQSGCGVADYAGDADFALIADPEKLPPLEGFAQGSQDYPDRSTTLLAQVQSVRSGRAFVLAGPGIEDRLTLKVKGLPALFPTQWAANRSRFPRGVDLILVAPDGVVCLPRTVRVDEKEA